MKFASVGGCLAMSLLFQTPVWAQEVGVEGEAAVGTEENEGELDEPPEPEPEPPPAVEPVAPRSEVELEEENGGSDHEKVIGHFGVGYMGRQSMSIGFDPMTGTSTTVTAPVIGARYWLSDLLGLEAGIGLNISGGKNTVTDADGVRKPGLGVYIIHVGAPLNLMDRGSFSFQAVPEVNFGLATTGDQNPADDIKERDGGVFYNIGARVGAELQFGFMGIPELSLQGFVGLYFQGERATSTTKNGDDKVVTGTNTATFGTTLGPDPWDVFTGSISALYYF